MLQADDHALALLLIHFRRVDAERLDAARVEAARRGCDLAAAIAADGRIAADELHGFRSAATYLVTGGHLFACAPCGLQLVAPGLPDGLCPSCQRRAVPGILPRAREVRFDTGLERRMRRLILDLMGRGQCRARAGEAQRLRAEGRVGKRREEVLAPPAGACPQNTLGRFRLLELLARGSCAYVYRAEDTASGRTVALKVLYAREEETEEARRTKLARFTREAELASRLEHPNLVSAGPLECVDGRYCIPMDLVDGPTLAQVLEARGLEEGARPGGPDVRALIGALADVARGLHYAHTQGVVHRDVNPRNILFTRDGQARLGDFGLAKPVEIESAITGKETLGTLAYISPERMESEARSDARSDVYSLGVILFEILTGKLAVKRISDEWLAKAVAQAPSDLPPATVRELVRLARAAIATDPAARPSTALDFAQALEAAWEDEGTGERPTATPTARAATAPGRPTLLAVSAFLAGALVMAVLTTWSTGREDELLAPALARIAELDAPGSEEAYDARRTDLAARLAAAQAVLPARHPALSWVAGRSAWARGDLAAASTAFAAAAADPERELRARLLRALCDTLLFERLRSDPEGRTRLEAARAECGIVAARAPGSADARFAAALIALLDGRPGETLEACTALAAEAPERADVRFALVWVLLRRGTPDAAIARMEAAGDLARFDPLFRLCHAAALLSLSADPARAPEAGAALAAAQLLGRLWPAFPEARAVEGRGLLEQGKPQAAAEALEAATRLEPRFADAWRLTVKVHLRAEDPYAALAALSRLVPLEPGNGEVLFRRAQVFRQVGDAARAEADLRACLEAFPHGPYAERAKAQLEAR